MTTDGTPNGPPDLTKYFYDSTTGMLYLWIGQTDANAVGPSPLGTCKGAADDPVFCPQITGPNAASTGEAYYNCPAEGCPTDRVTLNDPNYVPGASTCPVFGSTGDAKGWANGTTGATWPGPPANLPVLVYADNGDPVTRTAMMTASPHYADAKPPACAVNQ